MPARALVCSVILVACAAGPRHRGAAQPTSRAIWELLQQGDQAYDLARYRLAARLYDRAIESAPFEVPPPTYARRAHLFELRGQYDDGLRFLESKADRVYAEDWEIHDLRLGLLQHVHRRDEASTLARRLFDKRSFSSRAALIVGFDEAGKCPRTSAQALEWYLHLRPGSSTGNDPLARLQLGFQYLHLRDYEDALAQFTTARTQPGVTDHIVKNIDKGECAAYSALARWTEALVACEAAIADGKLTSDPSPWFNAARVYLALDRPDDAITAAEAYLTARPEAARAYRALSAAHAARGDAQLARDYGAKASASASAERPSIPSRCLHRARTKRWP